MSRNRIVMVVSGFPRRSETFMLNELLTLEARGLLAAVFATKPGDGSVLHPDCHRILDKVRFLPPGRPVDQAEALIASLDRFDIAGIHGYFAHTPAEVASHVAGRLGVPYGFSAHALDLRKVPEEEMAERAGKAACVVACNRDAAAELSRSGAKVKLLSHGVDIDRFRPTPLTLCEPVRLLAVGRLVEKKGFHVLIEAVRRLSFPFHLRIIGEGPERARLAAAIFEAGLSDRVEICGGMTHAELPGEYAKANILVVPSIQSGSGDRDGLPNVVLEGMASGRPIIGGNIGAIGSAVAHGETGMLVPPGDASELATTLETLVRTPGLCVRFGQAARRRVERDFELGACTERFCRFLERVYV